MAIVVYDITSRESFEAIDEWVRECKMNGNRSLTLVLVGNKIDLISERKITYEEGEQYAMKNGMLFFETSAKTADGINKIFYDTAVAVNEKINEGVIDPSNDIHGVKLGTSFNKKTDSKSLSDGLLSTKKGSKCC